MIVEEPLIYSSIHTRNIQVGFNTFVSSHADIDLEVSASGEIRALLFDYFRSELFLKSYFGLCLESATRVGIPFQDLVLQTTPTPRVFRPGDHGTSFHCDYWYGHGEKSYTVWTPLTKVESGNTFLMSKDIDHAVFFEQISGGKSYLNIDHGLLASCSPVLPPEHSSIVFGSKVIHGSPINSTNSTRISFDFRFGYLSDKTSSKDLENYYRFDSGAFKLPAHPFFNKKIIKYICGGPGKNTFAQHALIDAAASRFNLQVSQQEAEVERFGFPMLQAYLDGLLLEKGFDGIILASKSILSEQIINRVKSSNVPVWSALESAFLNAHPQ